MTGDLRYGSRVEEGVLVSNGIRSDWMGKRQTIATAKVQEIAGKLKNYGFVPENYGGDLVGLSYVGERKKINEVGHINSETGVVKRNYDGKTTIEMLALGQILIKACRAEGIPFSETQSVSDTSMLENALEKLSNLQKMEKRK